MSSNDGKMGSGPQSKLDIEAFRNHLLNYRSKADESELDVTDHFVDLDSSFKRMLDEKRQMTNKENNPPAAIDAVAAASSINPPEKPLRKDLLKERLRSRMQDDSLVDQSSYVMEHSIGTDMEFSTINRLLADFNINRDSSVTQRRSPFKSLKITGENSLPIHPQRSEHDVERTLNAVANANENQANNDVSVTETPSSSSSSSSSAAINAECNVDDTLEEIEYVLDLGLNYVPKRLINEIKLKSEVVKQEVKTENIDNTDKDKANERTKNDDDDDEIIVLDSSPENSFTTTMTTERFKSAFESIENTFYTAKSILNNVSVVSIDSDDSDEQPSNSEQSTQDTIDPSQCASESHDEKLASVLQKTDISVADSMEMSTSTQIDNSTAAAANADMGMPNFDDSLERVEYMMEQAQKMMNDKTKQLFAPMLQTEAKKTPVSQTKLKPKVLTPNSAPLKKGPPKHLTPNKGDLFKRPDQRNARSPFTAKTASASKAQPAATTHGQSRIPTKIPGSLHKPQFRHIASPIAAYIKNTPEVPLLKTIKPMRNLLTEDFAKACKSNSSLDESTQSVESFPTKSALPRKMYISAQQRKIIDHRHVITPGGKTVQKLIGNQPLVIRHDGKIRSNNSPARIPIPQFEESLSDLSMISGDISVQVVQDVHRLN